MARSWHGPSATHGIEPGLSVGGKRHNTDSFARLFNLLVVFANPGTYQQTSMPRGIVPDQEPVSCPEQPGAHNNTPEIGLLIALTGRPVTKRTQT